MDEWGERQLTRIRSAVARWTRRWKGYLLHARLLRLLHLVSRPTALHANEPSRKGEDDSEGRPNRLADPILLRCRSLIDLLLLGYIIYQFVDSSHDAVHGVGWRLALVGVLNAIYLHVFVTGHYLVAFIFALLVASTVSTVYWSLSAHYPAKDLFDAVFVHLPFSLWHAWSLVTVFISGFAAFTQ